MPPKSRQQFGGQDGRRQSARDLKREEERLKAQMEKQEEAKAAGPIEHAPAPSAKKKSTAAQLKQKQNAAQRARLAQQQAQQAAQAAEQEDKSQSFSQNEQKEVVGIAEGENHQVQEENGDLDTKNLNDNQSEEVEAEQNNAQSEPSAPSSHEADDHKVEEQVKKEVEKPKGSNVAKKPAPEPSGGSDEDSEPSWAKDISSDSEELFDEAGNQKLVEKAKEKKEKQKQAEQEEKLKRQLEFEAQERGTPLLMPGDLRAPIVVVLGHVDTGKTSLLDRVRRSSVQAGEAGGITQQIGASFLSKQFIQRAIRNFPKQFNVDVPGLLLVDTPGHENFRNLRSRGQSLADVGVLVIDVMHGIEQQTVESIQLLKASGAPFLIALNKIDMLYGWQAGYAPWTAEEEAAGKMNEVEPIQQNNQSSNQSGKKGKKGKGGGKEVEQEQKAASEPAPSILTAAEGRSSLIALKNQRDITKQQFNERLQAIKSQLYELDVYAELWTEVKDLKNTVPIVPTSAKTAEGLCDLIALLIRFCQQLQEIKDKLVYEDEVKCTIMEVRRSGNLGYTLDCILVNGIMKRGQKIVLAGPGTAIFTTIKQILTPAEAKEIREASIGTFKRHESIQGASGFKIAADNLENAIAGSNIKILTPNSDPDQLADEVVNDLCHSLCEVDGEVGVGIQGSSLGSLEAFKELLKAGVAEAEDQSDQKKLKKVPVPVSHVGIGPVTVKTIQMVKTQIERGHKEYAVVLAFGVKVENAARQAAREADVTIYEQEIVYRLLNDMGKHLYDWHQKMRQELKPHIPCVLKVLHVFHNKNPVILGAEIISGSLRKGEPLALPNGQLGGKQLGYVQEIQVERKQIVEGVPGQQVAIKLKEPHGKDANNYHVDAEIVKALDSRKNPIICVQITRKCIDTLKLHFKDEIISWVGSIKDSKALLKIE